VGQKAICESQRINDTIEDNLQGAFAFLRTHLYKKMPGSPYAPFYFIADTGMFASFFFECRATSHAKVRTDQRLCQNLVPYEVMAYIKSDIWNSSHVCESLPFQGDPAPITLPSRRKKKKNKSKRKRESSDDDDDEDDDDPDPWKTEIERMRRTWKTHNLVDEDSI
jgi:hypothetical protein